MLDEIKNEEKKINSQIFKEYFHYQSSSFLTKDLCEDNQIKDDRIVKDLNDSLIDLRNSVNRKKILENINSDKKIDFSKKNTQLQ